MLYDVSKNVFTCCLKVSRQLRHADRPVVSLHFVQPSACDFVVDITS